MVRPVQISDELYALVEQVGADLSRSMAQLVEHWARIGAAVDSAGLTTGQVLEIMGKAHPLTEKLLSLALIKEHKHRGAAAVVAHHARNEAAVRLGKKSAKSLHVVPTSRIKGAKLTRVSPPPDGQGW